MEIEAMSFAGFVGTIHSVSIQLTDTDPLNPNMPHVTGPVASGLQIDHLSGFNVFRMVEKLELNANGVTAEESEINPSSAFLSSERQW